MGKYIWFNQDNLRDEKIYVVLGYIAVILGVLLFVFTFERNGFTGVIISTLGFILVFASFHFKDKDRIEKLESNRGFKNG